MFNATFLVQSAEGLGDDQRQNLYSQLDELAGQLGQFHVIGDVLPLIAYQAGDINLQISFTDRDEFEAAKESDAWAQLKDLVADTAQVGMYQYAAYPTDLLNVTDSDDDGRSHCHRWLFHHVREFATPEKVDYAMYGTLHMQDYIDGFNNSMVARIVESEGTNQWDVVFECDFDDENAYAYPYENHPAHTGYIGRFWNAMSEDSVFAGDCTTSAVTVDGPVIHRYAEAGQPE